MQYFGINAFCPSKERTVVIHRSNARRLSDLFQVEVSLQVQADTEMPGVVRDYA